MQTNYTKLADLYAVSKARSDEAAKETAALRLEVLATGKSEICGDAYRVTISVEEREWLDRAKARALLSPQDLARISKKQRTTFVRVKGAL